MTLQDIITQIISNCPAYGSGSSARVYVARDISEIDVPSQDTPACWVLWSADNWQPNAGAGALKRQARERQFTVITVAEAPDAAGNEPLEAARQELFNALVGWEPSGERIMVEAVSGETDSITGGLIRWADTFGYTEHQRRTG